MFKKNYGAFNEKILLILVALMPSMVFAEYDARDSEIARLTSEKRQKYAELEKCVKSSKGLQIAGISTLGLTAGGVALNVAQHQKKKSLDNQISATQRQIEKKQKEAADKQECEKEDKVWDDKNKKCLTKEEDCKNQSGKEWNGGECVDKTSTTSATTEKQEQKADCECFKPNAMPEHVLKCAEEGDASTKTCKITECKKGYKPDPTGVKCDAETGDCSCPENASVCKWNAGSCEVQTCKDNYHPSTDKKSCNAKAVCNGIGEYVDKNDPTKCGKCDQQKGEVLNANKDGCKKCDGDEFANNGLCHNCNPGEVPNDTHSACVRCGTDEIATGGKCEKCTKEGTNPNSDKTKCVCSDGKEPSGEKCS